MKAIFAINMHCSACKASVESGLINKKGILSCSANLITNSIEVEYNDKEINEDGIIDLIKKSGYKASLIVDEYAINNSDNKKKSFEILKLVSGIILASLLMFIGMGNMYSDIIPSFIKDPVYVSGYIQLGLTLIIILLFNSYYRRGIIGLIKLRPDMDSLVFLSSIASLAYSLYLTILYTVNPGLHRYEHIHYFYDSAAMILVIVSIGKLIENLSKNKAKETINGLLKLRPNTTHLLKDNDIFDCDTKFIQKGNTIVIKPGEAIPLDGFVLKGSSFIDESMISGESNLIEKNEDDKVYSGTINKDGTLYIVVTGIGKDSTLSRIIDLVNKATNMKSSLTKRVDKISRIFTPLIILIFFIVFFTWFTVDTINGSTVIKMYSTPFEEALAFGIGVLSISCPCALGLATPISLLIGSSVFSKNGILINDSSAIEKINLCDAIVLDKTNTITEGKLEVEKLIQFKKDKNILNIVYSLEKLSSHPFSESIATYLSKECSLLKDLNNIEIIPGKGVKGKYLDKTYYIGSLSLVKEIYKKDDLDNLLKDIDLKVGLISFYLTEDELLGVIFLKDHIKENSYEFIQEAKKRFKKIVLLTGDNIYNANEVAKKLGIDEVIANATPIIKEEVIAKLKSEGYKTIMVGDGVNDSIALTYSDVSIGLAKGSDIAMTSSDFILMNNNLSEITFINNFSKKINNNIKFNLFWAFIYNLVFIPVAAGVFAPLNFILQPTYCAMLMALSSVSVCLNSLLLLRYNKKAPKIIANINN